MKLTIILILLPFISFGQTTSQRLAALEKQQTVFKSDIKFLRAGKTADSIALINHSSTITAQSFRIKALEDSVVKFKLLVFDTTYSFIYRKGQFADSIALKKTTL